MSGNSVPHSLSCEEMLDEPANFFLPVLEAVVPRRDYVVIVNDNVNFHRFAPQRPPRSTHSISVKAFATFGDETVAAPRAAIETRLLPALTHVLPLI